MAGNSNKQNNTDKKRFGNPLKSTARTIDRHPIPVFVIAVIVILAVVIIGNRLRAPAEEQQEQAKQPIAVQTYSIGKAPTVRTQAEIEKSGVIKVVAQTAGVVQDIQVTEGDAVYRGQNLVWLSTNYQGGSVPTLNRQKAQEQFEFNEETYETEKDVIKKQREQADLNRENTEELREISEKSIKETKDLLSLNSEIIKSLNEEIEELENNNQDGSNDTAIRGLKQQKAQITASVNQLNSSVRNTEYQTDDDNPPAKLADIQRELTYRNLEIQEKSLELNKEVSLLNLRIAQVNEALMYPASPCPGVVERVHVNIGQSVNPGDLIATITADENTATAVVYVTPEVAATVSKIEPAQMYHDGETFELTAHYITREPINGTLHGVFFTIPEAMSGQFSNRSSIDVELPVGYAQSLSTMPFIPLDAVYQTQDSAFVYVTNQQEGEMVAAIREVTLGDVYGSFVQVTQGLEEADQVIINRSVVENDVVTIQEN